MVLIPSAFLLQLAAKFGSAQMQKMSCQILTVSLSIVDIIQNVQGPVADLASFCHCYVVLPQPYCMRSWHLHWHLHWHLQRQAKLLGVALTHVGRQRTPAQDLGTPKI